MTLPRCRCGETRPEAFRASEPYRCKACRLTYNRTYRGVLRPRGLIWLPPAAAADPGAAPATSPWPGDRPIPSSDPSPPPEPGGLWPELVAAELERLDAARPLLVADHEPCE
jgi:hypothetical protein